MIDAMRTGPGQAPGRDGPADGTGAPAEVSAGGAGGGRAGGTAGGQRITCGFCGAEFREDPSQATCQACPLHKACGFVRCPDCGYENPRPPRWLATLRRWASR